MPFEKQIQMAVVTADIIISRFWPFALAILGLLFAALLYVVIKE
jgi:hypothetical protein